MASGTPACVSQSSATNKKSKEPKEIKKKIRATLFFDGTKNNKINTFIRINEKKLDFLKEIYDKNKSKDNDTSYDNYYSNIALLSNFINSEDNKDEYEKHFPIYIEGIGTVDQSKDSGTGYIAGTGDTGVEGKVSKALDQLLDIIKSFIGMNFEMTIEEIRLDVFGFSRGAAAARHFVNRALNETVINVLGISNIRYPIKEILKKEKYTINKVKVYFVGLFDTVSSVGLINTAGEFSNVAELGLNAISAAESVYHLAAADEHRKNFALTNIDSACACEKEMGKVKEVFLPGVHSDIGGSYNDNEIENFVICDMNDHIYRTYTEIESELNELILDGWFNKTDLFFKDGKRKLKETEKIRDAIDWLGRVTVERQGEGQAEGQGDYCTNKGIRNLYSRIPLHLMKDKAIENKLSFFSGINTDKKTTLESNKDDIIPDIILKANKLLKEYAKGPSSRNDWKVCSPLINDLRKNYFHFSAQYGGFFDAKGPRYENGTRTRKIHIG